MLDFVARAAPVPAHASTTPAAAVPLNPPLANSVPIDPVASSDPMPAALSAKDQQEHSNPASAAVPLTRAGWSDATLETSLPAATDMKVPSTAATTSIPQPAIAASITSSPAGPTSATCRAAAADCGVAAAGCQKHRAVRKGRCRGSGRSRKRGITPDHMLYWLLHMRSIERDDALREPASILQGSASQLAL